MVLGDAAVHDGALKLTTAKRWQTGSIVMQPDGHLSPLRTFDTNFEVLIGGGRVETEKMEVHPPTHTHTPRRPPPPARLTPPRL